MSKQKQRPELYYTYLERSSGGEALDPDDEWTSHAPTYVNWSLTGIQKEQPKHTPYWDVAEVLDADDISEVKYIYAVLVTYTTGSTFGSSHGNGLVAGLFVNPENAKALEKKIYDGTDTYEDLCSHCCRSWDGYFESLEDCDVRYLDIKP